MSQHVFVTILPCGVSVEVLAGWDRPLQSMFLVVDYTDAKLSDEKGCMYSNLEDQQLPAREWRYFSEVLAELGIVEPSGFGEAIRVDMLENMGNTIRQWDNGDLTGQ